MLPPGNSNIPRGGTIWCKLDPSLVSGLATPRRLWLYIFNYDAYETNISGNVYKVDKITGAETLYTPFAPSSESQTSMPGITYTGAYHFLIEVRENGTSSQNVSVWWKPY